MHELLHSAGGIVIGDHGTVALIRNRKDTLWFFPKGQIQPDETDEAAARREIHEESGLQHLELLDDLGSYVRPAILPNGTYSNSKLKEIHMFLFAAQPGAEVAPVLTDEIAEAVWMPLQQVGEQLADAKDKAWFAHAFERVRHAIQRD